MAIKWNLSCSNSANPRVGLKYEMRDQKLWSSLTLAQSRDCQSAETGKGRADVLVFLLSDVLVMINDKCMFDL